MLGKSAQWIALFSFFAAECMMDTREFDKKQAQKILMA